MVYRKHCTFIVLLFLILQFCSYSCATFEAEHYSFYDSLVGETDLYGGKYNDTYDFTDTHKYQEYRKIGEAKVFDEVQKPKSLRKSNAIIVIERVIWKQENKPEDRASYIREVLLKIYENGDVFIREGELGSETILISKKGDVFVTQEDDGNVEILVPVKGDLLDPSRLSREELDKIIEIDRSGRIDLFKNNYEELGKIVNFEPPVRRILLPASSAMIVISLYRDLDLFYEAENTISFITLDKDYIVTLRSLEKNEIRFPKTVYFVHDKGFVTNLQDHYAEFGAHRGGSGSPSGSGIPSLEEFPGIQTLRRWDSPIPFDTVLVEVLNKYFPRGYELHENNTSYYITTFAELTNLPINVSAYIYLCISFPYKETGEEFYFRLQYIVDEYRSKEPEPTRATLRETMNSTEKFISDFINDLYLIGGK